MKSFRRGVASGQAVHWVCQPDASSREIQTHTEPGARGRGEQLSEVTKITTSDRVVRQTKPFDEAWDGAKVDQKDLDERRNSWTS